MFSALTGLASQRTGGGEEVGLSSVTALGSHLRVLSGMLRGPSVLDSFLKRRSQCTRTLMVALLFSLLLCFVFVFKPATRD